MTRRPPRVSIGIPVFNGEKFLAEALDSALAQTYRDFEIVISDNASTDGTADICREFVARDKRVRYYRNEANLGASANYRRTFELSLGEYFCWLPSDEAMMPEYLTKCVEVLDNEPEVVLAFPRYLHRTGSDQPHPHPISRNADLRFPNAADRLAKLFRERIIGPNWPIFGLYRSGILLETGLIRPVIGADDYLTLEIALRGQMAQIPEELYVLRTHPDAWHQARQRNARGLARFFGTETVWAAAWFDPENKRLRVVFPHWRRLKEFFLLIVRSEEGAYSKLAMIGLLPGYAVRHLRRLTKEVLVGIAQLGFIAGRYIQHSRHRKHMEAS